MSQEFGRNPPVARLPEPSFSDWLKSGREIRSAGRSPNNTLLQTATRSVKSKTPRSTAIS